MYKGNTTSTRLYLSVVGFDMFGSFTHYLIDRQKFLCKDTDFGEYSHAKMMGLLSDLGMFVYLCD